MQDAAHIERNSIVSAQADSAAQDVLCAPLPVMLFDRAGRMPGRPILTEIDGESIDFAGLLDRTGRYMSALAAIGVQEGHRVAVLVPQSIDAHSLWNAIAWSRCWEVPINNEFHGAMLAYILNDSRASCLVLAKEFLPVVTAIADRLDHLRTILVIGRVVAGSAAGVTIHAFDPTVAPDPRITQRPILDDGDVATVIYTSGTTGPSKGVIIPWGELYTGMDIYGCRKDGTDALYTPFPTNHISGKVPIFNMVAFAGRGVLRRRFSTKDFWRDVRDHHCTGTILLGGTAMFLANQPVDEADRGHSMHTVLMVPVIDGYEAYERRFGVSIMTIYGMSECGFPFLARSGHLANAASCGRLRDGWHVRIVDDDGTDVAAEEVGELLVRCDAPHSIMVGYLDRPEATADALRDGWFHTGDAFRADAEGNYYFVDRIKDAIRRRGENISSFEVESFVQRFPGIVECAAVAVPSEVGEDEIKVVFVAEDGVDVEGLAQFCQAEMPAFMVPRFFERLSALPYTPTNKVQKAQLRATGVGAAWDRVSAVSGRCVSQISSRGVLR